MIKHLTEFSPKWPVKIFHFKQQNSAAEDGVVSGLFTGNVWKIDYLDHLKADLNLVKQQLEDKDLTEWSQHTSITDASAWIRQEIEARVVPPPEMLTRAWVKLHEILSTFPVIDASGNHPIRGLFLCEAPGAFVSAANHFIHNKRCMDGPSGSVPLQWMATSLNPYASHDPGCAITDDSLIKFTLDNWFFGDDNTGNILSSSFLPALQRIIGTEGMFDLVTGDGGTSFVNDPENQEKGSLALILAEVVAALHALKPGGSFVLKVFSLMETQSLCLVYMLRQSFVRLSIFKPISSKAGNNELYLVCRDFIPNPRVANMMQLLKSEMKSPSQLKCSLQNSALLPLQQIPLTFVIEFESAVTQFSHWQKEAIEANLMLHEAGVMNSCRRKELTAVKKHRSRVYVKKFPLRPIQPHQRLVIPKQQVHEPVITNSNAKEYCSSNTDLQQASLQATQRMHEVRMDE